MRNSSGGGRVQRLLELLEHLVGDELQGVQPDQVGQPQRPIGWDKSGHHRLVDILDCGEAAFHHSDRRQQIRHQQSVDHEAGPVRAAHHLLAQHRRSANCSVRAAAASEVTRVLDQFDQRQHRHRVEEVQAQHPAGFWVAAAIFMIGMLDVLEASTASGSVMTLVERRRRSLP